jgi:hypothetical protein
MLPHTTNKHYITGITALNIPSKEGTGDWHFQESFYGRGNIKPKISLAGEGESLNTNPILADFGIYECSQVLRECGLHIPEKEKVYAANHYRAVLDMLYRAASNQTFPYHLNLEDWFNKSGEVAQLLKEVKHMEKKLPSDERKIIEQWLIRRT